MMVDTVQYTFETCPRVHEIVGVIHDHRGPCGKWPIGWRQEVAVGDIVAAVVYRPSNQPLARAGDRPGAKLHLHTVIANAFDAHRRSGCPNDSPLHFASIAMAALSNSDPHDGGERCMDCGASYILWWSPSTMFTHVLGWYGPGLLCPSCFDRRAQAAGIDLLWVPHRWGRIAKWWMSNDVQRSIRRWRRTAEYRQEVANFERTSQ